MLHLKSLVIHRFKSFRHAELLFNNGFTCIVGRNGSGKSTIFDALIFGLGVTSRKRLRVNSLKELLSDSLKVKKGMHKAYVKLTFSGDDNIEVTRYIRSDGKHAFRVNGKRMKKSDVMELLAKHGIKSDYTNTMLQGEINRAMEMNPKERRELIDIASGIKEFDVKKDESLKELEKVEQKMAEARVSLNERTGFLKELEKEKEVAESYTGFTARLRSLKYSMLAMKKEELQLSYDESGKKMSVLEQGRNGLRQRYDETSRRIEQLGAERQSLISELNERTASSGERSKKLELSAAEMAKVKAEVSIKEQLISQHASETAALEAEMKSIAERLSINSKELESLKNEEQECAKVVGALDFLNLADQKSDELKMINQRILELSYRLMDEQERFSGSKAEADALLDKKGFYSRLSGELADSKSALVAEMNALAGRENEILKRLKETELRVKKLGSESKSLSAMIEETDMKLIELREQRSFARQRNSSLESRLNSAFGEKEGFYGKAALLCSYEIEHSAAIEAAAGSRLEYFVVDDIDSANRIIAYIKKNGLGRASFIPLKEIRTAHDKESGGIKRLVELVRFDKKFAKAFGYIFDDTLLADSIEQMKKEGIGKHRYVTVEGELVERSGIISGGSGGSKVSVRTMDMGIEKLEGEKRRAREALEATSGGAFEAKKDMSLLEGELRSIKDRAAKLSSEIAIAEKRQNDAVSAVKELEAKHASVENRAAGLDKAKLETAMEIESLKVKLASVEKGRDFKGAIAEDRKRLNDARAGLDSARVRIAELSKENEMLRARSAEIDSSIKKKRSEAGRNRKEVKELEMRGQVLEEARKKIEEEIRSSSNIASKSYEKIKKMDSELQSMGTENGKVLAELSNAERELNELNVSRSQTGTRLSDVNAEFASYETGIEVVKGGIEEMEAEANLLGLRIKELGNVNLKAPEIYGIKKAEVDEAEAKVGTLESEKESVLNMINEIESKKLQIFMDTFNEISKNFSKLHRHMFADKEAVLRLSNMDDPLQSGLDICVKDPGALRSIMQLSGGEKAVAVLVLLFAIYTYRPSGIYIFDEVDSALDKDNSRILSKLIKDMAKEAQFVVVSHNDSLVVDADAAVGVIKESVESNVVGVEIAELARNRQVVS